MANSFRNASQEECEYIQLAIYQERHEDLFRLLQAKKINLNFNYSNDMTPLGHAVRQGSLETINTLLAAGADPNMASEDNAPICFCGVSNGNGVEITTLMKLWGATLNPEPSESYSLPLNAAIKFNQIDIFEALLELGANPFQVDAKGVSAFQMAHDKKNVNPVFDRILKSEHRTQEGPSDMERLNVFLQVIHKGRDSEFAMDILNEYPYLALMCNEDKRSPLSTAAMVGNREIVNEVLTIAAADKVAYKDLFRFNVNGYNPLMLAAQKGHDEILDDLLTYETSRPIDFLDKTVLEEKGYLVEDIGFTPLMHGVFSGHLNVVRKLLENGANPNIINADAQSALTIAVVNVGDKEVGLEIISELLHYGADRNYQCASGKSSLDLARHCGLPDVEALLQENVSIYRPSATSVVGQSKAGNKSNLK